MEPINDDENHLTRYRIFGLPWPYDDSEATNKFYVDQKVASGGGGGSNGIIDGGSPTTNYTGGPVIDCGGIT